jgi:hypothetical protein
MPAARPTYTRWWTAGWKPEVSRSRKFFAELPYRELEEGKMDQPRAGEVDAVLAFYEEDRKKVQAQRLQDLRDLGRAAVLREGTVEALKIEQRRRLKPYYRALWVLGVLIAVVAVVTLAVWLGGYQ